MGVFLCYFGKPSKFITIMELISRILVGLVAIEHLYILWLEMFAWETAGKKTFKGSMPDHMFAATKSMAAN